VDARLSGVSDVMRRTAATLVLLAVSGLGTHGQTSPAPPPSTVDERDARSLNLTAYAELLRSDVRAQKVAIITEVMGFTEVEDKAFWPLHREYESEMAALGDERVALIAEYAKSYSTMTDAIAQALGSRALDLEARRHAVKVKYHERFAKALSPRTSLRFLQVEHQLQLIIDLQISAALPIVK
jgi:hypothetical protein